MKAGDVSRHLRMLPIHTIFKVRSRPTVPLESAKLKITAAIRQKKVDEGLNRSQASSIRNSTRNISDRQQDLPARRSRRRRAHHI